MIIENKGSFQAKADTFFLIFMYFKEKKTAFVLHFKRDNRHSFCLDFCLAHPWHW